MSNSFQPTGVNSSGLTALIQNLGRDCTPTQFLREFVKNAFEACQRADGSGRIEVDFNESLHASKEHYKISFTDNGDGMTADQMVSLLNNLSATGSTNQHKNYGVGAKISALTRNHEGIIYESWRDGQGHLVAIRYNEDEGVYGLQGAVHANGLTEYAPKIPNAKKPKIINGHGTRVTLLGMSSSQDTMLPPEGVGGIRESWIVKFLNTRFFKIPEGVELFARIGYYRDVADKKHNHLLRILGQKAVLDGKAENFGEVQVTGAKVYWWIMPEGVDGHGREVLKGHSALLNQDEIFDISDARSNRLAYFGVIFGRDRIVIYVEPENAVQNTARTGLVRPDGSPLKWDVWQDEFRQNMPPVLRQFLDKLINENSKDSHADSIRERLKSLKDLFRISRYRRSASGKLRANPDSEAPLGTGHTHEAGHGSTSIKGATGARSGELATSLLSELVDDESGVPVELVSPDPFPQLQWSEESEALRDRAAEYLPSDNLIVANKNFQGLQDLIVFFSKSHQDTPELLRVIEDVVKEAFEQVLIECVAGALSLRHRQHWNIDDFDRAISREALTTVVMQRYWMCSQIRRTLGSKIKGFNDLMNQPLEVA
ncbi:ATP-binding protein [Bradyrhizobium sp. 521_C7_N1_3]|uniref:ATP-binding protein n=1 Tax=Bradyrhizobium TaxID=374 RepID=UPI002714F7F8|nr:ATP-binding protein [Bradyrhizobium japonicum]WLB55049.1 ATP-binding protein [Bradyrhizobium japonicum]WLB63077.1 ATP-binding protein [Bradyrhizobium japonicum]